MSPRAAPQVRADTTYAWPHGPLGPLSPGPAAKSLDHGLAPSAIGISALVAVLLGGRACARRPVFSLAAAREPLMRASFGAIAFTLLLSLPAQAVPQRPDSTYQKALALELPTLTPPIAVHYSPGYGDRAAALQRGARAVRDLLGDSLGLSPSEVTLLVLDSADWAEVTELPYGLHALLEDDPAFLAPAEMDRGIYHDDALGGREAELGVDVVGLHYLAHFYATEALYGEDQEADPRVKWLDELFTLMLQDVLLAAADRRLIVASWRSEAESLRLTWPRFTRLDDFDHEYSRYFITPEGAPNYSWFLARLALWAREVRAQHGLGALLRVRRALAERAPDLDTPAALAMLEAAGIATDRWRDGGAAVAALDRFIAAFNAADEAAIAAAFGPQAEAHGYALGVDRSTRIDWLPDPWRRHGLDVPPGADGSLTVLDRLVSGSLVTQRERLEWRGGEARGSLVRTVVYKIRGGRIHRVWYTPAEPDPDAVPAVATPAFPDADGPIVWIDAWHRNMHTPEGSYWALSELLRRDGLHVRTWEAPFTGAALDTVDVLVVANATAGESPDGLPGNPGAFGPDEVEALVQWVEKGGALLLIADHAPFAGAAAELAARFGAEFHNGVARDTAPGGGTNIMFRRADGTLRPHPITDGGGPGARVDSVATFAGQAFRADEAIRPLIVLPSSTVLETRGPAEDGDGPAARVRVPVGGWLQAGVRRFGAGRVALFGEAALFRFLAVQHGPMRGAQNAHLALNLFRWLAPGAGQDPDPAPGAGPRERSCC